MQMRRTMNIEETLQQHHQALCNAMVERVTKVIQMETEYEALTEEKIAHIFALAKRALQREWQRTVEAAVRQAEQELSAAQERQARHRREEEILRLVHSKREGVTKRPQR